MKKSFFATKIMQSGKVLPKFSCCEIHRYVKRLIRPFEDKARKVSKALNLCNDRTQARKIFPKNCFQKDKVKHDYVEFTISVENIDILLSSNDVSSSRNFLSGRVND